METPDYSDSLRLLYLLDYGDAWETLLYLASSSTPLTLESSFSWKVFSFTSLGLSKNRESCDCPIEFSISYLFSSKGGADYGTNNRGRGIDTLWLISSFYSSLSDYWEERDWPRP